jgi:RecA-family ATPase
VNLLQVFRNYFTTVPSSALRQRGPLDPVVPSFVPVGLKDFLALDIPARGSLLHPILPEKGLVMTYSPRGMGKSWFGRSIALAVSHGLNLMRWTNSKPKHVLLVDGEMPLADLQIRLRVIATGLGISVPNDNLKILAADQIERGINLSNPEDQRELEKHLDGVDLLILDNLSTLTTTSEGASDAWLPIQTWLLKLRRMGTAVLLIHHAGLNGRQRGTSRREDALDTVIALRRPIRRSKAVGSKFTLKRHGIWPGRELRHSRRLWRASPTVRR